MSDEIIKKEDLFNVIKHGTAWFTDRVKEKIEDIISKNSSTTSSNHFFRWENDNKYNYIYDNDCYLFVFDGKIELRCDRENVYSSDMLLKFPVKTDADIELAYERFKSMTMEDDEE